MSTAGTIKRRTLLTGTNNPAYQASKDWANDSLVIASAAPDGAPMVRDSAQSDGWGFFTAGALGDLLFVGANDALTALTAAQGIPYWSAAGVAPIVLSIGAGLAVVGGALTASGGVAGGSNSQVQYNAAGVLSGDPGLTYDAATDTLTAGIFAGSGASLTGLSASALAGGTIPDARFPATLPAISGANLTALNASALGSGTAAVDRGGTGLASYAIGDLLFASGATALSKLADVAAGSVLASGGVGEAPAWSTSPTLASATLSAGTGTETYTPSGLIHFDTTQVGNFGVGEDTLMTFTLPANTLNVNGRVVRVTAFGMYGANSNNKELSIYFGATKVASRLATPTNNKAWIVEMSVVRTGAATQIAWAGVETEISGRTVGLATPAETLSGGIVIKLTATGVSDNDIVQRAWFIEVLP